MFFFQNKVNAKMFNIEEFLDSLPTNIQRIDVSNKNLTYLPSLKRFTNLKHLHCQHNSLTELPELNGSLRSLECDHNLLTELPALNDGLETLYCENNLLWRLPPLNDSLQIVSCSYNHLTELPPLNDTLEVLFCYNNHLTKLPNFGVKLKIVHCQHNQLTQLPQIDFTVAIMCANNPLPFHLLNGKVYTEEQRHKFNRKVLCLERFKELFWAFKFKKPFRDWLWLKVRLPRIQTKYHPELYLSSFNEEELNK